MTFKFIGIEADISGHAVFDRFGQAATLPDGMEQEAAAACCLPAEQFDALFTADEVDRYAMPAAHDGADSDFLERKRKAAAALAEFRKSNGR